MPIFPEELHPKHHVSVRFDYDIRAEQYLEYFKIIISYPTYEFVPLHLKFETSQELRQYLINRGIIYYQRDHFDMHKSVHQRVMTIVDTQRIYDIEDNIAKYLLNYKYYSINEVAEMLSFSRPTIYKLVNEKSLKSVRINGQLRINHLDLMTFINEEKQ